MSCMATAQLLSWDLGPAASLMFASACHIVDVMIASCCPPFELRRRVSQV
jgi:hypothetical protein